MTPKRFKKFLERDGGCVHCGDVETAVPNHRANRGMGGSKIRDVPSNIVVLCANMNNLIESSSEAAQMALDYGWKLNTWQDPMTTPYWSAITNEWVYLDNEL